VWKAERANDEEQKKIEILKKEMAEEQQIYELKKLHQESTGKYVLLLPPPTPPTHDLSLPNRIYRKTERLDWMYDGMVAGWGKNNTTTAEEYLLGKKYEGNKEEEDVNKVCVHSILSSHFLKYLFPLTYGLCLICGKKAGWNFIIIII
jgi:Pre-mRNA splicing factor